MQVACEMDRFATLRARSRKWFTGFLTLGDPQSLEDQAGIYLECGVDVLEVGVPDAHPYMDGPVVSESMRRAVQSGVTHDVARQHLAALRRLHPKAPIVAMGYADLSPVLHDASGAALADGVLQIGVAPADALSPDVARIGFVSHRTSMEEIARSKMSGGYVMLQANEGRTGIRRSMPLDNQRKIGLLRQCGVEAPILLGIGVSSPEHVALAVRYGADGVVIGSACLQAAQSGERVLRRFLRGVRAALDDPSQFLQ